MKGTLWKIAHMNQSRVMGFFFVTIAICALLSTTAKGTTWVQWEEQDGGNGHWYAFVPAPNLYWPQARDAAASLVAPNGYHATLATITSAAENEFVFNLIDDPADWSSSGLGPWLGGYQITKDQEPEGGWDWVTGEDWNYTNWDTNQPDNSGMIEDYLNFGWSDTTGSPPVPTWNDQYQNFTMGFVAEAPIPEPATIFLFVTGLAGLTGVHRRRKK